MTREYHVRSGQRCRVCRALVTRRGLVIAGGPIVYVIRCPRCDHFRPEDDR